jgi:DNA-binding LytR/AlgR family response regulator
MTQGQWKDSHDEKQAIIHLDKNGKVTKHMLRSSLSKLAEQIEDQDILQVHRSYLVNFENVLALSGKSPNYVLELKNLKEEKQ